MRSRCQGDVDIEAKVRAMAKFMFFTGFDSVSMCTKSLLWTLGSSNYCAWQKKLASSFQGARIDDLVDGLRSSELVSQVVSEGLRMFAPPIQTRLTSRNLEIDGRFVFPQGSELRLLHFFAQRDALRWGVDSEIFKPDRHRKPSSFVRSDVLLFSGGKTPCIGAHLAVSLIKVFLIAFVRRFLGNQKDLLNLMQPTRT